MKPIEIYLNESLYHDNEIIEEGFKDFIRKFAITAAVATSCLTAVAKPIVVNNPDNVVKTQKEILVKAEKDTKKDCKLFIANGSSEARATQTANNAFVANFGRRAKILDTQIIQTKMNNGKPLFKCVIIYTEDVK